MTEAAAALLRQALELTPKERTDLAADLLASLEPEDDPETVQREWAEELERRAYRALAGESEGEDWETVYKRLADKFSK